jgi:hypothetical protein
MSEAIVLVAGGWLACSAGLGMARAWADVPAATPEQEVTLAWRDADGQARAIKIDRAKLAIFREQQTQADDQERYQTRTEAVEALDHDMAAIFTVVRDRVPHYADWYFRYPTKYALMLRAARAALRHVTTDTRTASREGDIIHAVEAALSDYLQRQLAARVLTPARTESEIEAVYDRTLAVEHDKWQVFRAEQDRQLIDFVSREGIPIAPAAALVAGRAALPPLFLTQHHPDVFDTYVFRSGLLKIRIKRPRVNPRSAAAQPPKMEGEEGRDDRITGVLVDMFSKIVDPLAARVGDLLIGATAGGVVGAMAGGSSLTVVGMTGAVSGAALVPLTALFGVAVSLASDYAANEFEESLTRPAFEQNITDIVAATEDSIKRALILTLSEHIDASHDDVIANTAIDRLVITQ